MAIEAIRLPPELAASLDAMDAPPEKTPANPSDETLGRPSRNGETRLSNALETQMASPLVDGQRFGDFKIRALIGRGKAGFVYSADDLLAKRRCALKLLCRMSSHDLYRNKLGFRRMTPFRHPCLMRTDRIEIIDDYTVLSMEEIEGETLYAFSRRLRELPTAQAYQRLHSLLHDYAVGLTVMHFAGLVHRDLKPTNLMVRNDGHGVIVDYGLVANCDPETDPFGLRPYIAGTPRYFSPEALWEQSYTPAGDIFSLGLVMLDCLNEISGSDRWLRQGDFADWVRDEDEEIIAAAVRGMDESIPPLLRMAVAGMLNADRTKRPSSMDLVSMTKTNEGPIRLTTTHHLFGRENELEQCNNWIRGIYRGETGRLHIHGEAGAGKTRLLDEIERQLRQNQWGQVFRVKCRSRESGTLQVMDQIADQIAQRYARSDRDRIKLDPVSASILTHSFPQMRHVIEGDLRESAEPFPENHERLDALSAAARLSRELRKVGPLIIIIDDAQWSDHDSNTVWDELQKDTLGGLGIITSSRSAETNQRQPANERIHVGPLPPDAAFSFLQTAATRWGANINQAGLHEFVEISRCNAFRLQELAEEFRPGGMLHRMQDSNDASISNIGDIDRFWRARFARLSDDARKILAFIVTAGAPVSVAQLADLTGFGDRVDLSIFELVNQRLVIDDATGKECITVVHDKIADGLIENLDATVLVQAHLAWAELLTNQNRPRDFAARIAGHYYAAKQDGTALPFAIVAAENADRAFAKSEAGEWHEKVLQQVAGDARDKHLRDAARCFHEADLPEKAAHYYLVLAENAHDRKEQLQFQTQVIQLLLRSGQMDRARPLLVDHANALHIPICNRDTIDLEQTRTQFASLAEQLTDRVLDEHSQTDSGPVEPAVSDEFSETRFQLRFCSEVSRSLAMLDFQSTVQLILFGARLALEKGTREDRLHFATMASVWSTLLAGKDHALLNLKRGSLDKLRNRFAGPARGKSKAEIMSGLAFVNMLAMDWHETGESVDGCLVEFASDQESLRFEITHTRWVRLWADWHIGRWKELRAISNEMVDDASRRNDSYQQLVASTGHGGNAYLIADQTAKLRKLLEENNRVHSDTKQFELINFFKWMQSIQLALYAEDYRGATMLALQPEVRQGHSPVHQIPLVQATTDFFTALTLLHGIVQDDAALDILRESDVEAAEMIQQAIDRLNDQKAIFPRMLAALLTGIQQRQSGNFAAAKSSFETTKDIATKHAWLPYQLAATDALDQLENADGDADSLKQQLMNHWVVHPEKIERLYTVAPPEPDSEN